MTLAELFQASTDEQLKSHFTTMHDQPRRDSLDPVALQMEVNDLRATVKEEKWYSAELKKELANLQGKLQAFASAPLVPASGDQVGVDVDDYLLDLIGFVCIQK